jgi:hypothetical protein
MRINDRRLHVANEWSDGGDEDGRSEKRRRDAEIEVLEWFNTTTARKDENLYRQKNDAVHQHKKKQQFRWQRLSPAQGFSKNRQWDCDGTEPAIENEVIFGRGKRHTAVFWGLGIHRRTFELRGRHRDQISVYNTLTRGIRQDVASRNLTLASAMACGLPCCTPIRIRSRHVRLVQRVHKAKIF